MRRKLLARLLNATWSSLSQVIQVYRYTLVEDRMEAICVSPVQIVFHQLFYLVGGVRHRLPHCRAGLPRNTLVRCCLRIRLQRSSEIMTAVRLSMYITPWTKSAIGETG